MLEKFLHYVPNGFENGSKFWEGFEDIEWGIWRLVAGFRTNFYTFKIEG